MLSFFLNVLVTGQDDIVFGNYFLPKARASTYRDFTSLRYSDQTVEQWAAMFDTVANVSVMEGGTAA